MGNIYMNRHAWFWCSIRCNLCTPYIYPAFNFQLNLNYIKFFETMEENYKFSLVFYCMQVVVNHSQQKHFIDMWSLHLDMLTFCLHCKVHFEFPISCVFQWECWTWTLFNFDCTPRFMFDKKMVFVDAWNVHQIEKWWYDRGMLKLHIFGTWGKYEKNTIFLLKYNWSDSRIPKVCRYPKPVRGYIYFLKTKYNVC